MQLKTIFFILSLCSFSLFSTEWKSKQLVLSCPTHIQELDHLIPSDVFIEKITYDCDVRLEQEEFAYLMDIKPDMPITLSSIKRGIECLFKKKKYEAMTLIIDQGSKGLIMHLVITGLWTFKKLKLKGMLINKEYYRQFYTLESGEPFDQNKHDSAIQKMKDAFAQEGYYAATVDSSFFYDYSSKQVVVTITLKKNHRFSIDNITLTIQSEAAEQLGNTSEVRQLCNKHFVHRLQHSSYSKVLITKETRLLQRLLAQKGYNNVDIQLNEHADNQRKTIDLHFIINVHQKKECIFTGNVFFSRDQLLDVILQFGQSVSLLPASLIAEEITQIYDKKGFWKVQVKPSEQAECYVFDIVEGPRARVNVIEIENVSAQEQEQLVKDFFSPVITSDFYDAEKLNVSLDKMYDFYSKKGFWQAQIVKQEFVLMDEQYHIYKLILTLDPGECSYLTSISIQVNKDIGSHPLLGQLEKKDLHIPFNAQFVQDQRRILIDYFKKIGYRSVDVKPEIKRNEAEVSLIWKVSVGQSNVAFGKTVIIGDTKIPFKYIQRELQYKEGNAWNNDAIKDTFLRLKAWEVFDNIHIYPDHIAQQEKEKDVIVKLQEDDPYELRLRGGLELQQVAQFYIPEGLTYKLGGSFILKSPFHRGDQLRVDADFARVYRELAATYQIPWLFNQPIKSLFMVYSNKYLQPGFVGGEKSIYDAVSQGVLAGFNRKFDHIDLGLNIGFEWLKTSIPDRSSTMLNYIDSISHAINFDSRLLNRSVPFFQLEPTIMLDYADQKMSPTSGFFTLLSLKGMVPLTRRELDAYFVKALMEQSFFFPIKSSVVATRIRAGHIFFKDFKNVMPMERFYLGGANSLRSYDTDFAPPLGFFVDGQDKRQYVPQGGQSMLNLNMELRFPVYKSLGGVVFQDIGALSGNHFADFSPGNILLGTGFGVRIATPVGPLRFDIGWKWAREPEARSYAWFLTFGQAF